MLCCCFHTGLRSAPWTRLQQCTPPSISAVAVITARARSCSSNSRSSTQQQDASTDAATQAPTAGRHSQRPTPSPAQQQAPSEPVGEPTDGVQLQTPVSETVLNQQAHGLQPSEHSSSSSSSSPGQAWTIVRGRQGQPLGRARQQAAAAAQDAQRSQAGLLRLSGTEQELFSQAISYVPPAAAAAQLSEVAAVS